jgi:hypothetical protein
MAAWCGGDDQRARARALPGGEGREPPLLTGPIVLSLAYGGVPYLVGAGGLWFWMRGQSADRIALVSYLTPIILLPLFLAWMGYLFGLRDLVGAPKVLLPFAVYLSAWWLAFGYCYVALVHVIRLVGERLDWLD